MKFQFLFAFLIFYLLTVQIKSFGSCGIYTCGGDSDSKDLDDPQCQNWDYLYDQNQNSMGKSKCQTDCQCDGRRRCVDGCCSGWPRTAADIGESNDDCLKTTYVADESIQQNQCSSACDCGGNRFCSQNGYCHGTATYEAKCLSPAFVAVKDQSQEAAKSDQNSGCNCQSLMSQAVDYILTSYLGDQNQGACEAFVDALQGKANDAICLESSLCTFLISKVQDTASTVIPYKAPFVNVCITMLNVVQDFTGLKIDKIRSSGRTLVENSLNDAMSVACGEMLCSGNCDTQNLNGVSFASVAVDTTCAVVQTLGDLDDITLNGGVLYLNIALMFLFFVLQL